MYSKSSVVKDSKLSTCDGFLCECINGKVIESKGGIFYIVLSSWICIGHDQFHAF